MRHSYGIAARAPSKKRDFFFQRVTFPLRDALPLELEKYLRWTRQTMAEVDPAFHWECAGPFTIAGRVTSLAIHPRFPNVWHAGSAAGGLWHSSDAGATWQQTWSRFANQSIGALGWTEINDYPVLIAATGEANMTADTYPGSGLMMSVDDGLTWTEFLPASDPAEGLGRRRPRRVGCLSFAPHGRIALGSVYLEDSMPAGLYFIDVHRGAFEPCQFWGKRSYNCHSVLFDPRDARTVYATIEPDGSLNGIWRSRDGGHSWEHLTAGLPPGENFRRTSLAIAPSDPDVIYALAASRSNHVLGVFMSTNGGNSWREILGGRYPRERQMSYNNTIAVHPSQPDRVIWGGMRLYATSDAGKRWRQVTTDERGRPNYAHNDHHALLWRDDGMLVSGNDGGVAVSEDGGRRWQERTRGMVTTMFYGLDVAPSNGNVLAGGTQDNGTLISLSGSDFVQGVPGDAAWTAFDPDDEESLFASGTSFELYHHAPGREWDFSEWSRITPEQVPDDEREQRAFTVLAINPRKRARPRRLLAATARLWCTEDRGKRWRAASPVFDRSPVSSIEMARANPDVLYAGTTSGGIFRSRDRGRTWSQSLSASSIPARPITSIVTHPRKANEVVVTVASTGAAGSGVDLATGDPLPYGHVFRSCDGGATWTELDRGELPNVAFYAAAFESHPPYRLFAAGDAGVWSWSDPCWTCISGNLPNAIVSGLVYHQGDRTLTAATYGRGVWRMRVGSLEPTLTQRPQAKLAGDVLELPVDRSIPIPVPVSPSDGADIISPKLEIQMVVEPVADAAGYLFEFGAFEPPGITTFGACDPACTLLFTGAGKRGKWRVSTIRDGLRSHASEWRYFTVQAE